MKSVICLLKLGSLDAFHKDHDHKIVGSACAVSQRKIYFLPICYLVNQPPTTIISTTTLITCEIKRRGSNLAKQYNFKKQKLPGFLSTKMAGGVRLARHQTHLLYCELLYWFRVHSFVVSWAIVRILQTFTAMSFFEDITRLSLCFSFSSGGGAVEAIILKSPKNLLSQQ